MTKFYRNILSITVIGILTNIIPVYSAVIFELKTNYTTLGDNISLGELVKNITLPPDYANIPLGLAPFKNNERIIEAAFIRESLIRQQKTDYLPNEKGSVVIENKTAVLSAKEQEKIICTAIDTLLAGENFKLEYKSGLKDVIYPLRNKVSIQLLDKNRVRMSGNQLFQIEIKLNDRLFTKVNVNSFVRLYRKVLVSTEKTLVNDIVNSAECISLDKEVTGFENELVNNYEELNGYKAARLIPAGTIIRKSFLKPIPVIKRGDIINLTAIDDLVEISMPATALFDCQNGETVKFKINSTAAIVPALVTGPGQAELRR